MQAFYYFKYYNPFNFIFQVFEIKYLNFIFACDIITKCITIYRGEEMAAFKRNALTFLITFCISFIIFFVIALIGLSAGGIIDIKDILPGRNNQQEIIDTTETEENPIINFDDVIDPEAPATSSFTALLVGTDYQPKVTPNAPSSADTIILVRFSCETESVVFVNIPGITRTTVDGADTTLSKAYTDKGIEYLMEKVQGLTGLQINYYAVASVAIFDDIIDSLGGIDYTVPVNMNYEDEYQDLVIDLKKGDQHLDGENAIEMLRYRSDSYNNRLLRNTQFIRTLLEKYTQSVYKENANDLYNQIFVNLKSNFTEDDLLKYMDTIYNYSSYEAKILTYPGDYTTVGKATYFAPEQTEAIEMLAKYKNY